MPDFPEPFALRPREAAKYAGVCLTELYARLANRTYESFIDGRKRLVTVESIKRHQQKQFEASRGTTPATKPAVKLTPGPGRPRKNGKT
jgi:hypothetical protein